MPLQKSFDATEALENAMNAFWSRGYEATSVQDLVDCMGIGRGSLYASFGCKRDLFIQSLAHYDRTRRRDWIRDVSAGKSGRQAVLDVFDAVMTFTLQDPGRDGCLLVNTALEVSPHDEEIAGIVAEAMAAVEKFFRDSLEAAKIEGDVRQDLDAAATAQVLMTLLAGIRVFARSGPDRNMMRRVADHVRLILA